MFWERVGVRESCKVDLGANCYTGRTCSHGLCFTELPLKLTLNKKVEDGFGENNVPCHRSG